MQSGTEWPCQTIERQSSSASLRVLQSQHTPLNSKRIPAAFSTPRERWSAIVSRNPEAASLFVYAVKTTKIYCRPDCKARLARQANVVFYDSGILARKAGYRACKRCKPDLWPTWEEDCLSGKIQHAVELVRVNALAGRKVSLQVLSHQVGLSRWHLQRVFKRLQGLSPNEMQNTILNMAETGPEEAEQMVATRADHRSSEADQYVPSPMSSVESAQDIGVTQWDWWDRDNSEVDAVLKELFPELYDTSRLDAL